MYPKCPVYKGFLHCYPILYYPDNPWVNSLFDSLGGYFAGADGLQQAAPED
jgi:hypothetical protein